MKYDAITLDTNIFYKEGFDLEGGLLKHLMEFQLSPTGSVQLILSEIVYREVQKHLIENAENTSKKIESAVKEVSKQRLIPQETHQQLAEIAESVQPSETAKTRLKDFVKTTGAEIIPAEGMDIKALIESYFTPSPPFEKSDKNKKKNEFPDAIALLSLEAWAASKQKKLLAVSNDEGWANFARDSQWIDVESDLTPALQKFQEHAEVAASTVATFVSGLESGEYPDIMGKIRNCVSDGVSSAPVFADIVYPYYSESETELTYEGLSFLKRGDDYDIGVVQSGQNRIIARIGVLVSVNAVGHFYHKRPDHMFKGVDPRDIDEVPTGKCIIERESDLKAAILVILERDFSGEKKEKFKMSEIELIQMPDTVNFGDVDGGEEMSREFYLYLKKELENGQYPWEHRFAADCTERVLPIIKRKYSHLAPAVESAVAAARMPDVADPKGAIRDLAGAMADVDRATRRPVVGSGSGAIAFAPDITAVAVARPARDLADSPDAERKWQADRFKDYKLGRVSS